MYRTGNIFITIFLCLLSVVGRVGANEDKISVVTSFSILQDLVKELGGEYVSVVNLVGRNSDAHMYQAKPSDALAVANADLIIFNGLEFEGWISRLIKNSGYQNRQLIASNGVDALIYGREVDPHAWQSFANIRVYIKNITGALIVLRPERKAFFIQRETDYLKSLSALQNHLEKQLEKIPKAKRVVVTSHDAFGYLGRELDIQFLAPVGLSIEVEASAADVAAVISQIRKQKVSAIFIENTTNSRLLERIAAETGVVIGGKLYSDALSEEAGPAGTYLNMMRHNIESLVSAFNRDKKQH